MDQVLLKTGWEIQEVYATDMHRLTSFYEQLKAKNKEEVFPESFGLPFLIVLNEGEVAGFASLVADTNGEILYKCYSERFIPYFSESECQEQLNAAFAKQRQLFTDAGHLHSGISKLLRWINHN